MNDVIVYRPYRLQAWLLMFTIPTGMLAFLAAGYYMLFQAVSSLALMAIGIICVWLSKLLYNASKITVTFEQEGLRIMDRDYNGCQYRFWCELSYAYYVKSFKGHLFLVLSPKKLSPKEAKHLTNRGANSSKVCIDYAIVIYLDILQNISKLKELIEGHVLQIDAY